MRLTLGYGVMVTLQILVLSFLVRVRVPQQMKVAKSLKIKHLAIFFFINSRKFPEIKYKRCNYLPITAPQLSLINHLSAIRLQR